MKKHCEETHLPSLSKELDLLETSKIEAQMEAKKVLEQAAIFRGDHISGKSKDELFIPRLKIS